MHELQIFNNEEFGEVRTVVIEGEPWFVGKDVAEALGFKNPRQGLATNVADEDKGVHSVDTPSGTQQMTIINESGLYALIFGSKLESAKRFKHWVTSEVLPTLRKTGTYEMPNMSTEMKAILMIDQKQVKMEQRMDKLEYDIPLYGSEVYRDIYDQIKREFGIYDDSGRPKSYKALKRKYIADAHELIDCYEAPTFLEELIEIANAQMNFGVA